MQNKKAQLKIQETAFMLVAIMLFFILVGLFVLSIFYSNLQKQATSAAEENTLSLITNLADSPEFSCVQSESRFNCVDTDKLMGLKNNKNYDRFWSFTSLKVIRESGFGKSEEEMVECDGINNNCDVFTIYNRKVSNERIVSSFVALCWVEYENGFYEKCEIGKLVAGTEVRG